MKKKIKRIGSLLIFLTSYLLTFSIWCYAGPYEDGTAAAKASGNEFLSEIGSSDQINDRISVPMTSDNSQMMPFGEDTATPTGTGTCPSGYSYDIGTCIKQSFTAQISAPSSENFLQLTLSVQATYDVDLEVQQDTDLDGSLNYTYTSPYRISGVCTNGIISCNAGTWTNCTFYTWAVTSSPRIILSQVSDIESLAGCYCINSSCGSTLPSTNPEKILSDLGTGVVGTIQSNDPLLTVTKVENIAPTIRYYGQNTSAFGSSYPDSGASTYYGGTTNPQAYYTPTDDSMTGDGINEAADQMSDTDSLYYKLISLDSQIEDTKEIKSCVINKVVSMDAADIPQLAVTDTCSEMDMTGCSLYEETVCDYAGKDCATSVKEGSPTGETPANNITTIPSSVTGDLWTFTATGLQILYLNSISSGILSSGADHWWRIKQAYLCDSSLNINTNDYPLTEPSSAYMAMDGVDRSDHTRTSAVQSGDVLAYEDYDPSTGTSTTRDITLQPRESEDTCENACKVQVQTTSTEVGTEGKTSDYQNSVDSFETIYKTCGQTDVCELEPGEELIQDCTCINDFPEAAAALMMIEEASKDMICSSE